LFGDIEATADITRELARFLVVGNASIENPTPSAIMASYAVLHFEGLAFIEVRYVDIETALEIFRVYTLSPAVASLLVHGATCELKPT
jgi:hypothetical protein